MLAERGAWQRTSSDSWNASKRNGNILEGLFMRVSRFAAVGVTLGAAALVWLPTPRASDRTIAQQDTVTAPGQIRVGVGLVNIYATVRDKHNGIVANLKQEDFHIYEDGVEQKVAFFSNEKTLPITLGLLIDTSGSEQFMLEAEKSAAVQFLNQILRPKDEAMIMSFDLDADLLADWTTDKGELDRAVRRAQINAPASGGPVTPGPIAGSDSIGTVFRDAVYLACNEKLSTEAGRKALVILTDADDQGSKVSMLDAIEAAQRADAVVHILLISESRWTADAGAANKLTSETGGRVIDVNNPNKMRAAFDEISDELRSEYMIGYYPSNSKRDGTYRKIKVEVGDKNLKVLSRKGYYAAKD
jgi:VWFA-related protein